jgi:hypothetical protein
MSRNHMYDLHKYAKIMVYQPMQLQHKLHEPHKLSNPRGTKLQFGSHEHDGNMFFHKVVW